MLCFMSKYNWELFILLTNKMNNLTGSLSGRFQIIWQGYQNIEIQTVKEM